MKHEKILTIFFETASQEREMVAIGTGGGAAPWGWYRDLPTIVDFANVIIEVVPPAVYATDTSTGDRVQWTPGKPTT